MRDLTPAGRFWNKVVKGPRPDDCWLWTGAVADDGYGRFTLNADGRTQAVRPHRFAFHLVHEVPLNAFGDLMHRWDVPICVRVTAGLDTHLEPGTNRENMADRRSKRRDANGSMFRWRGLSRDLFVDRSRLLRDEVRIYGWSREERIRALIAGADPDAPTLF